MPIVPPPNDTVQVQYQPSTPQIDTQEAASLSSLHSRLQQIIADNQSRGITTSVSLNALNGDSVLFRHGNTAPQFAASLNKLPITVLLLEDLRSGRTSLDTLINWAAADVRPGFGAFDQTGAPTSATVRDLLYDLLNASGTTAVRVLVNYSLGGPRAVNDRLAAYPELVSTRLEIVDPATNGFYLGDTTSDEALWSTQQLMAVQDDYQTLVRQALTDNIFSYFGVRSQLEGNDFIVLVNKVGILDDAAGNNRHDVGIIYNTQTGQSYGYAFMTTSPAGNIATTAHAEHSLDLLGRHFLRYAGDKPASDTRPPYGDSDERPTTPEQRVRY